MAEPAAVLSSVLYSMLLPRERGAGAFTAAVTGGLTGDEVFWRHCERWRIPGIAPDLVVASNWVEKDDSGMITMGQSNACMMKRANSSKTNKKKTTKAAKKEKFVCRCGQRLNNRLFPLVSSKKEGRFSIS